MAAVFFDAAVAKLDKAKLSGADDGMARCPAHRDRTPSLSLTRARNGGAIFHCFAGCDREAVEAALGVSWRGVSTPTRSVARLQRLAKWTVVSPVPSDAPKEFPTHSRGQPSATWTYRDEDGQELFHVLRFNAPDDSKEILPLTFCVGPNGQRQWRWQSIPSPRPLYGLDRLAARPDAPILVTEGEKVADAAEKIFPDYVATTSASGSNSAGKADWLHVHGRGVVIWGDADEPGRKYAVDVAHLCSEAGATSVSLVDVPDGFPRGWDLADDPPEGTDLRAILNDAEPFNQKTNGRAGDPRSAGCGADDEALFEELAELSPVAYDRRRKEAAKRLSIRESTLDGEVYRRRPRSADDAPDAALFADIEPWPDSVAGDELLDALIEHFCRFAVLPDEAAPILALWVLHAHAHDAASVSPILAVLSPEKRCGKTTVLSLVQAVTPRALSTSNITSAALFRTVEGWAPTLLIDEADTFLRNNEELRGVLNSGHNRLTACVVRTVGDDHTPAMFRSWSAKAIGLIGLLPDTLADRAVTVTLRRKRPDERVERLRLDRMNEFEPAFPKYRRYSVRREGDSAIRIMKL